MTKQDPSAFMDKKFEDKITKFKGTCTGVSYFANGCVQLLLSGGTIDAPVEVWLDEQRITQANNTQARSGGGHARSPSV